MFAIYKTEKAIAVLSRDHVSHIDMIEPLRRGMAEVLYAGDDGAAIYERNSGTCMVSMRPERFASTVDFHRYDLFAVHQGEIAETIMQSMHLTNRLEVFQASYREKEPLPGRFDAIRPLTSDFAEQVSESYSAMNDRPYIDTLIGRGQLWGIFDGGALAGFIGEHLEGSIGLLEVLPEYQRKGYGYTLECFMINRFLSLGRVPFCQVKTGNSPSLALQQKIGMEISGQTTAWLF